MKKQNKIKEFIATHKPEAIATVTTVLAAGAGVTYLVKYMNSFDRDVTADDLDYASANVMAAIYDYNDLLDKYNHNKK